MIPKRAQNPHIIGSKMKRYTQRTGGGIQKEGLFPIGETRPGRGPDRAAPDQRGGAGLLTYIKADLRNNETERSEQSASN